MITAELAQLYERLTHEISAMVNSDNPHKQASTICLLIWQIANRWDAMGEDPQWNGFRQSFGTSVLSASSSELAAISSCACCTSDQEVCIDGIED